MLLLFFCFVFLPIIVQITTFIMGFGGFSITPGSASLDFALPRSPNLFPALYRASFPVVSEQLNLAQLENDFFRNVGILQGIGNVSVVLLPGDQGLDAFLPAGTCKGSFVESLERFCPRA